MVADSNPNGTMFGGWLMGQVDIAGSVPAMLRAQGGVVTAAVTSMNFNCPLFVGDLLSLYAEVIQTGRSSITVNVDVWVQRDTSDLKTLHAADAQVIYVAVDGQGKTRPLP